MYLLLVEFLQNTGSIQSITELYLTGNELLNCTGEVAYKLKNFKSNLSGQDGLQLYNLVDEKDFWYIKYIIVSLHFCHSFHQRRFIMCKQYSKGFLPLKKLRNKQIHKISFPEGKF